jgi:hypothetical protein
MTDREIVAAILAPRPLGEAPLEECFRYLSKGVAKASRGRWGDLVFAFRAKIVTENSVRSYADIAALDLLYVKAVFKEGTPWKGRSSALEALEAVKKGDTVISRLDKMDIYAELGADFLALEDVKRAKDAFSETSLLAIQLAQKGKALKAMEKVIDLAWRYEAADRPLEMPSKESLFLQFGTDEAKLLLGYAKTPPRKIHDPVETNPMYLKVIDEVNELLYESFEKSKKTLSLKEFNKRKKEVIASFGLEWNAPTNSKLS